MPRKRPRPRDMDGGYVDHTLDCDLMVHAAPEGCDWCGGDLPLGRRRWCSDHCAKRYEVEHSWKRARLEAKRKARRGRRGGEWQYECNHCGDVFAVVEVNHIEPCRNMHKVFSCHHHQDNCEVLCVPCHREETRAQHARGELLGNKPKQP